MKAKLLSLLLALTCVSAAVCINNKTADAVKAEDAHKLTFDTLINQYSCSVNTNGWWDNVGNESYSANDGILTLDFASYPATTVMCGYSNPGVMVTKVNYYYKVEFEMKNSNTDTFQLYVENNAGGWFELATIGNEGEGWHSYSYTFKALKEGSNLAFQQGEGLSTAQIKNMYIYEVARDLEYGDEIGELPQYPEDASGWTIDGTTLLTSTSTFDFNEDKVAKPFYPSTLVNGFTINGTPLTENISGSSNFESTTLENGELTLTGVTGNAYWTNFVDVVAGETYYLVGKYKTSEGSGVTIAVNNPWVTILGGVGEKTRQYRSFFYKYQPNFTGSVQMLFQCAYNNLGKSTISLKDVYFGKGFEVNYGNAFTELPQPLEETDGWMINNQIITSESLNNYGTSENIAPYIANPYYQIKFPLANYVSNEAEDLMFKNVGDTDYRILNVEENHKYLVEFEYKTPQNAGIKPFICKNEVGVDWENVGYEGVTSPNSFTKLSYTFTAKFTGELQLIIQDAYQNTEIGEQKFEVKNYNAYEVMKLRHNDTFEYLPAFPASEDPLLIPQAWLINGETITVGSTFNSEKDEVATISYDTPSFTLSFDAGEVTIDPITVKYGEEIGELPETPAASEGHHYVWGIDGEEITSSTVYSFNENKTATLIERVNSYTIVFKQEGKVLETRTIEYGSQLSSFPEYEINSDYNYHWEIDGTEVNAETLFNYTSNKECNLVKVLKTYIATFKAGDVVIGTATFNKEGYLEELPAVPTKEGYDGVWNEVITFPNHDMTVEATYSPKTFEIYFVDDAGNRIAMYRIKYGQAFFEVCPTWPQAPEKEGYTFKSYQLNGKDVSLQDVFNYTSNQMITATYTKNEVNPVEPEKKGCGGSIIAASTIVSALALVGVTLITTKKKEN